MADVEAQDKGLPPEIWDKIFRDLSPVDHASVARVCKAWETNSKKFRDDKRVAFMLEQAQAFRNDIAKKLKIAKHRHGRLRGRGAITPAASAKPEVEARLKDLMRENLRMTKLYNTAKKATAKDKWDPKIGKEIMAAGRDLLEILKAYRAMGFDV